MHSKRKNKKAPLKEKLTDEFNQVAESNEQVHLEEKMKWLYAAIDTLSEVDKAIILLYLEEPLGLPFEFLLQLLQLLARGFQGGVDKFANCGKAWGELD